MLTQLPDPCDEYGASYNFTIAPLGVKPQALGAALFAIRRTAVRLVYHYPLEVIPSVARGCGTTWTYFVTYGDLF